MTENNIYNEPYCVKDGCLYETVERKGTVTTVRLCDYAPVLKSEITFDDGTERRKAFEISAVHSNGTTMPTVTVTADEMSSMKWLIEKWGSLGSYSPANNTPGKIRHAIMSTKSDVEFRTVYSQTGWRKIGEQYEFLMPSADSKFTVELQGKLNAYHWSASADKDKLFYLTALLENGLLPQRVMLPLLAVTFLSPLEHFLKAASCEPKFITALVGKTGTRKSTTAALMCSFFGNFTASTLPMSFHDTANSILSNIYSLKDVLTCVDDLHPNGVYGDSEMKSTAQNLSRFYGDRIGRARLNSKIELQPSRPPTGMCLVTAEYVPEISQSGLARYFIVEMKADDIDLALMTEYQQLAADGVLASIMYSYVDWLRETYLCDENTFVQGLSDTFKKYRADVTAELYTRCESFHTRVPDTLAHMMIGFDFLLAFLNAKEEIGVQDLENYKSSFRNIIVTSSVRNNSIVENENYSYQFCDKLKSLLDSGRCSVNVIGSDCDMNRKGFIGFEDDNYYYLIMNAAFSEVVKLSKEMGESFSIGKNSLIQQLVDDGIMVVSLPNWSQNPKGRKMLMSKNTKSKKNTDVSANYDGVYAPKIRFPLYIYPETMKTVESLYKSDNCSTKTEFMEKAIRFYCAHLMQNKPELIEYLAPQIAHIVEGYIMGTEQRLSRAIFKLAVEVGAQTHMLAAINDIEDGTLFKLREMVTDELRRINGIINFESAVRYQRSEEE